MDRGTNILKQDVLDSQAAARAGQRSRASRYLESDIGVGERAVEEGRGAHCFIPLIVHSRHVEADCAIVDRNSLESPAPVPDLVDGGNRIVECEIANGELLVSKYGAKFTPVEDKVVHKAARTILDE